MSGVTLLRREDGGMDSNYETTSDGPWPQPLQSFQNMGNGKLDCILGRAAQFDCQFLQCLM